MALCGHKRLQFSSGGYTILCPDCGHTWLSSKDGQKPDAFQEFESMGLSSKDVRVEPVPQEQT